MFFLTANCMRRTYQKTTNNLWIYTTCKGFLQLAVWIVICLLMTFWNDMCFYNLLISILLKEWFKNANIHQRLVVPYLRVNVGLDNICYFNMTGVQQTQIVFNNIWIISSNFFSKHSIYVKDNSYLSFNSKYIGYQKLDLWGFIT